MQLNKFQEFTITTAIYPEAGSGSERELSYLALGLVSEAGEVAGKIKKLIRDGKYSKEDVIGELSDVYWYLSRLCSAVGIDGEAVLEKNYLKLTDRQQRNVLSGSGDNR